LSDNLSPDAPSLPPVRGRLLAIDHGSKVIGLAICDALWLAPRPFEVWHRKDRAADFAHINEIIRKQQIAAVIIGLPEIPVAPAEGSGIKNQADTVRRWASRLAAAVQVPVYFWEEQYSSFIANEIADELSTEIGKSVRRKADERIDDRAAAVILQSFIGAHPPGTALPKSLKTR
jgi:putative holliday junction resolvase